MINSTPTLHKKTYSAAALAILFVFALSGCAAKTGTDGLAVNPQLSQESQLTYDYLVYQDYLSRFGQIMRSGVKTKEESAKATDLQQKAIVVLDRILKVEPSAQLYAEKASLFWAAQQVDDAREALKEGLQKFPEDRDLTMSLSSTYLVDNRTVDAEGVLQDYIRRHPKDLIVKTQLARILLEQKKFAQALDILKVIPAGQRTSEILYYYAKASAGLGLSKQAIRALRKTVKIKPNYIEAWGELAYLYELEKDYDSAEKIYTKMLEFPEVSNHIRLRLIELCLKLNNPDRGLSLVLDGPRNTSFLLEAAQTFLNGKFYGQASTVLDIFVKEKDVPDAYYFFKASIAYEGEEDPAKALEFLNKIKKGSDHYDRSIQFKAHLLIELNRNREALAVLREGQKEFPDDPNFFLMEAALHMDQKQPKKAEETLLRGYKNIPDSTQILFQLGMMEEKKGNTDQTLKYMEKIISMQPDHADALNFVGYILADKNIQLDRAMVLISRANKLKPDNGFILDSMAWVLYRQGKLDEAWENIGRALSLEPRQPELWEHYGDIAVAKKNKIEAKKAYTKALKLNPESKELRRKLDSL